MNKLQRFMAIVALATAIFPCPSLAQPDNGLRPATDQELLASYCAALIRGRIKSVQHQLLDAGDDSPSREILARLIHKQADDLERLNAYMTPKLGYIDTSSTAAAIRRAEGDQAEFEGLVAKCVSDCIGTYPTNEGKSQCTERCLNVEAVTSRVNRCQNLSWLPF